MRFPWIIWMSPKCHHKRKKAEGDLAHTEEKVVWRQSKERFEDAGLEDWSDGATNRGIPAATLNWKRQDSPLEPPDGARPVDSLILDCWPPELWENKSPLGQVMQFVVTCYNSHETNTDALILLLMLKICPSLKAQLLAPSACECPYCFSWKQFSSTCWVWHSPGTL